jgi:hypothetical protein
MSKPSGISLTLDSYGDLRMRVTPTDRVADKIWEAVEEAIDAGMEPRAFRNEVVAAWEHELRERAKRAVKELGRP